MTIRLIALDLDGTTLRRDGTVSPRTGAALRRAMAAGVRVAVATGRLHASAALYARRLATNGPVISANGGLIRTRSGQALLHRPLPAGALAAAPAIGAATGLQLELFAGNSLFVTHVAERRRQHRARLRTARSWQGWTAAVQYLLACHVGPLSEAAAAHPEKLFISGPESGPVRAAAEAMQLAAGVPLEWTSSAPDNLELTAAGVTKGSAVAWLAAHYGFDISEVMVMGDSLNDLSMFELDCLKVAMGNADAAILDRASHVTAGHDADGVALAVERFVLGEAAI